MVEIVYELVKDGVKVGAVEVMVVVMEVVVEFLHFLSPDTKSALEVQSILIEEHSSLFRP